MRDLFANESFNTEVVEVYNRKDVEKNFWRWGTGWEVSGLPAEFPNYPFSHCLLQRLFAFSLEN